MRFLFPPGTTLSTYLSRHLNTGKNVEQILSFLKKNYDFFLKMIFTQISWNLLNFSQKVSKSNLLLQSAEKKMKKSHLGEMAQFSHDF